MEDFFRVDETALSTFPGRVAQARRELAAKLQKDVTFGELAAAAGVSGPAMSDWMTKGRLPTRENMKALAEVFQRAGLTRYTDIYLERGDPSDGGNGEGGYDVSEPTQLVPDPREKPQRKRA